MEKGIKLYRISDVLDNAELYISEMRHYEDSKILKELFYFILGYFDNVKMDDSVIEKLAFISVDNIYRFAASVGIVDEYTYIFFEVLIKQLCKSIRERSIKTFYILDNAIREDRFQLTVKLFGLTGFSVITPYFETVDHDFAKNVKDKKLNIVIDPAQSYSFCSFEVVYSQIKAQMDLEQNFVYIEKDASINYLDKIIEMGKKNDYLCVFRNQAPSNPELQIIKSQYSHLDNG